MKRMILSKINPTQRSRIEELCRVCSQAEPIRLSIPLPKAGEELKDERFFLLYADGRLVSLIHLFYPDHVVGELIGFTHPDFRGKHYFKRLLTLAADYAEEIGLEQVYVISDGNSKDTEKSMLSLGLDVEYSEYMLAKDLSGLTKVPHDSSNASFSGQLTVTETSATHLTAALFSHIFRTEIAHCEAYLEEISSDSRIHTYVLSLHGNHIGQTQLTLMEDMGYISGFGILPEYRGQGYGLRFLQLLEQLSAARSIQKLTLQVSSQNKAALSLYEKGGFELLEALHYYPLFEEE